MLYPQNGDRIEAIDSVTSLHPMYIHHQVIEKNKTKYNKRRNTTNMLDYQAITPCMAVVHNG